MLPGLKSLGHLQGIAVAFAVISVHAQQSPAPPPTGLPLIPAITANKGLDGDALLQALRKGGFVLYLRHAETGPTSEDCTLTNLTAKGRDDAKGIGDAIRMLKIPIGRVISSDVCRAQETARLTNVGMVEIDEDLHRMPKRPDHKFHEARAKLIATPPKAGTNTLLAGHIHFGNGEDQRLFIDMAGIIVFRPQGGGPPDVVARIRVEEWAKLQISR